ncbi:MAG TPA: hypothetical protein ENJ82_13830 [Bacteroidetes bacterium]|nr:hypothetical protein [Bacteroidota bacterium]
MENSKQLNLPKVRTFGEKFSDSFKFIRINLSVLLRAHFVVSLPIIVLTAGFFVLVFRDHFSLLQTIESGPFADSIVMRDNFTRFGVFTVFAYLAVIPVSIVTMSILDVFVKGNGEKADFALVMANLKKKYFRLFLLKLLISPLAILCAFLIFLPMGPALSGFNVALAILLFIPGLIFYNLFICADLLVFQHDYAIGLAISRTWAIMSRNFWTALPTSAGIMLLYFVFCLMLMIPLEILELIKGMTSGYVAPDSFWGIFLVTLRGFNTLLSLSLFSLPVVMAGIEYFTIRETNSRAGIMERIRLIGVSEEKQNVYAEEEQY